MRTKERKAPMGKVVDRLSEKAISQMGEYIENKLKDYNKKDLWKKAVTKACKITEGVDESFADCIINSIAVQRHFLWLTGNKSLHNIYYSFIITIAVELCAFNAEKRFAISFGEAILDNWFELNSVNYVELKSKIMGDEIENIVNDRERLYREYFMLYNDPFARDVIKVYYPKNGENWISWDKKYSIDIHINLSKGAEYGFCRVGFAYSRNKEQENERFLIVAYIIDDREVFRFEHSDMPEGDTRKILWAM